MFHSLKWKFIISFVILEFIFLSFIVGINFNSLNKASQTLSTEKINVTSQLLSELLKTPLIVLDLATIDDIVKNFSTIENAIAIQIETQEHNILSSYIKKESIPKNIFNTTIHNAQTLLNHQGKKYLFTYVDVLAENQHIGTISFVFNVTDNLAIIQDNKRLTYLMISIALLVSLLIAFFIGNYIGKSLDFLTKIAQDVAQDKKVYIPYDAASNDEIGILFYNMHSMQELISERTKKLNTSLQLFGDNVIASNTDIHGNITYASKAFSQISGYTEEELLGYKHSVIKHPEMPNKIYKDLWDTVKSGESWHGEIQNLKKNGDAYWVRASIIPNFDSNANIIGYTSIKHDITPQKAKEQFMANMSHELRTPLNAIIGFSSILEKKLNDSKHLDYIKRIHESSISLLTLINDILSLSKIKDSKFTIDPIFFNAYNDIKEHSKRFEGLTSEKNIQFKNHIDSSLQAVFNGDWHRISQIILNLVSNAVKFTPDGGEISCDARYTKGSLVLSVQDNGIGMKKEVQDKVFQPFEQADGSTTRKYGGTGLGLSITQSLVEVMGGKIELESQEGEGTQFKVSIPLEKIADEQVTHNVVQSKVEDKENTLKGHILIVEDNKTNQMLIKILIEDFGLTCDIANDGLEAIDIYNPKTHKLVLMDENMPNMQGVEAMKILHEKYKENCGAIIALTANAMEGDEEKFLNIGMDGYITKPIDEDILYKTLVKFLA